MNTSKELSQEDISRIVEMAWEDRTPFEIIEERFGLSEQQVIRLMRKEMKSSSFKMWRERVSGRKTKHRSFSQVDDLRIHCRTQYKHRSK